MAKAFITGKDGHADFTIASVSYRTVLDMFRIREVIEMFNTDNFSIEGVADQEAGRSQLIGEISGIGAQGSVEAGPLIPAPQDVSCVATYTTSCTITMSINMPEATADRLVNQNMRIGGRFLSKATYAVAWVRM